MHPALVPIKNDDPSIATLQQVDKMIVQVNREKGLGAYYPDYVQSDAELVDHIGEIVSGAWCGPEGIQIAGTLAKEGICVICTLEDIRRYKEEQLQTKKADAKDNQAYRTLDEIKKSGKIIEEGKPEVFFEDPKTERLRRFLQTFTYE